MAHVSWPARAAAARLRPGDRSLHDAAGAQAVSAGEQGKTVNQVMATLVAGYVERLLDGTCGWMASYVDLDEGLLRCVPADPSYVASLVGLHPNALVRRTSSPGGPPPYG